MSAPEGRQGYLLLAASQPSHGQVQALWFLCAGLLLLLGLFFVATAFIPALHKWMLNDEIYNSGRHVSPGYREFMTRLAPKVGAAFLVIAVVLGVLGLTA